MKKIIENFYPAKYKDLLISFIAHQRSFFQEEMESSTIRGKLDRSAKELYSDVHNDSKPVFALSTGRCGTMLLTKLLSADSSLRVVHEPHPELSYHSGWAYYKQSKGEKVEEQVIDVCRYESIRDAFLLGKRYVETNNRITFFANQLAILYPLAKFVHLERDVVPFVQSGYSRNWYGDERIGDEGRIIKYNDLQDWENYSQVQKISWLWWETNRFIRDFGESIGSSRYFYLASKHLFRSPDEVEKLLEFLEIENIPRQKLESMMRKPVNKSPASRVKILEAEQLLEIEQLISSLRLTTNGKV